MSKVPRSAAAHEAFAFGNGCLAVAGHVVSSPSADADLRSAIGGAMSFDEAVERAYVRATRGAPAGGEGS